MRDTTFFMEQLDEVKESWMADHQAAMQCRDLEDLLRKGIAIFLTIRQVDESWSKKVQNGGAQFDEAIANDLRKAYENWIKPCDTVLDKIVETEQEYNVDGAETFRECFRTARRILRVALTTDGPSASQFADKKKGGKRAKVA